MRCWLNREFVMRVRRDAHARARLVVVEREGRGGGRRLGQKGGEWWRRRTGRGRGRGSTSEGVVGDEFRSATMRIRNNKDGFARRTKPRYLSYETISTTCISLCLVLIKNAINQFV
jgi:hypothetical protein